MAETHEEIFRATIEIKLPNLGKIQSSLSSLNATTAQTAQNVSTSQSAALTDFGRLMKTATEQTRGFRAGLSLLRGRDGLTGVRVALGGTADSTNALVRVVDVASKVVQRLTSDFTKEERALIKATDAGQHRTIALRNAVNALKTQGKEIGVARSDANQLTQSIQKQVQAFQQQTQAARANGKVTAHGVAQMRNSTVVMRQQVDIFKDHIKTLGVDDAAYLSLIKQIEGYVGQSEREVDVIESRNKSAKRSREERDKETKGVEKQIGVFRRLLSGLNIFNRKQKDVARGSRDVSSSFASTASSMLRLVGVFTAANLATDALRSGLRSVTGAVSTFKDEFLGLGVIKGFMQDLITGPTELAARVDTLRTTLTAVGQEAGFIPDFLREKVDKLRDSGITTQASLEAMLKAISVGVPVGNVDEAAESVLALAATFDDPIAQMDALRQAAERGELGLGTLSKSAQNLAAAFGGDSSQNLKEFIVAINRGSTELLEANGIATNASELFARYAEVLNRLNETTEFTAQNLNQQQKAMAVQLGIIQETLPFASAYDAAMGSIGKQMSSMNRIVEEAKLAIGELFLPVLGTMLGRLREFLDVLMEIIRSAPVQRLAQSIANLAQHMNPISPVIRFLVSNLQILATGFADLIDVISFFLSGQTEQAFAGLGDAVAGALAGIVLTIDNVVGSALQWGWNLVANLANGIIEAAQSLLVQAANFIGDILSLFFAPGSPPKEGPLSEIDEWGTGLVDTLAGGMEAAAPSAFTGFASAFAGGLSDTFRNLELGSFRAIKDALGPIQGILRSMAAEGAIGEAEVPEGMLAIRDLMADLANNFEETGEISEEVLTQIGNRLGAAGEDMKKYIRLQFQLQGAQDELKQIDEEIADAEQAGFVPSALRKKKKEVEDRIKGVSEELQLQKEMLSWQQQSKNLMKEQRDILERIAKSMESAAKAGAKGQVDQWEAFQKTYNDELAALERKKDLGIISEEEYQRARLQLEKRYIDTAIKLGKPLSDERIAAFKNLQAQVKTLSKGGGGAKGLKGLAADAGDLRDNLVDMANKSAKGFESTKETIGAVTAEFAEMKDKIKGLFDEVGNFIKLPLGEKLKEIVRLFEEWTGLRVTKWFEDLSAIAEKIVNKVIGFFEWLYNTLVGRSIIPDLVAAIKTAFGAILWIAERTIVPMAKLFVDLVNAIKVFVERIAAMESVRRLFDRLANLAKVLGVALVIVSAALLEIFSVVAGNLGRTLVPLAEVLAVIVDIFARQLIVAIDAVVGPIEFFFRLFTEGPESAGLALSDLLSDLERLIPVIALMVAQWKLFGTGVIPSLISGVGRFRTSLGDLKAGFQLAQETAIGWKDSIVAGVSRMGAAILTFVKAPIATMQLAVTKVRAAWTAAMAAMQSSSALAFGAIGIALVALAIAVNKVIKIFKDVEEEFQRGKEAIDEWNVAAEEMIAEGKDAGDVVEELAKRVNAAREEFEKGGILTDVLAGGKDIEIYNEAARETEEILRTQTGTFEEYIARIKQYNELVAVDSMRITKMYGEEQFKLEQALRGVSDETEIQRIRLENLANSGYESSRVGRELLGSFEELEQQTDNLTESVESSDRAMLSAAARHKDLAAAAKDAEEKERSFAEVMLKAIGTSSAEVSRLLGEQLVSEQSHQQERNALITAHNAERQQLILDGREGELGQLKAKHDAELLEIDRRYDEEKIKRRIAIGEALLDLNERIAQEKLAIAELTGAEATQIVAQREQQAAQIAEFYGIQLNAAQAMADGTSTALRNAALANNEFLTSAGLTFPQVLQMMDRLQTQGYAGLALESQTAINEMIVSLALWQQENGASMADITQTLQALPLEYQNIILGMLDTKATATEMLDALSKLDKTFKPTVEISVREGKGAQEYLRRRSPETELEASLRRLKEFADGNEIVVRASVALGAIESIKALIAGIELSAQVAPEAERVMEVVAQNLTRAFNNLYLAVAGPTGSITRMIDQIKQKFQSMTALYAIIGSFSSQVVSMMSNMVSKIIDVFGTIPGRLWPLFRSGGAIYNALFDMGKAMMNALVAGAESVKQTITVSGEREDKVEATGFSVPIPGSDVSKGVTGGRVPAVVNDNRNITMIFEDGSMSFPGITTADDASQLVKVLDNLTSRGIAFQQVGAP